jgi:hypothetical protein
METTDAQNSKTPQIQSAFCGLHMDSRHVLRGDAIREPQKSKDIVQFVANHHTLLLWKTCRGRETHETWSVLLDEVAKHEQLARVNLEFRRNG